MLFKSRQMPSLRQRIRVAVWPRRSWSRSLRYFVKRLRRMGGTPHMIALGIAAGTFAACLPYLGVQFITAGILAWMLRASISAALLSTFIANPITLPFIWSTSYWLGDAMLGGNGHLDAVQLKEGFARSSELLSQGAPGAVQSFADLIWPILMPISLGSVPLGLMVAVFFYYTTKPMVEAYQLRRQYLVHG